LEFIIYGSERQIARPKDQERQKLFYSGKQKRHTVRNTFISNKGSKKIKVLGPTVFGTNMIRNWLMKKIGLSHQAAMSGKTPAIKVMNLKTL
jgi:hypothetical protein